MASTIRFSADEVCRFVGVSRGQLNAWLAGGRCQVCGGVGFTLADILGLAVVRELSVRCGDDLRTFAAGLEALFQLLATTPQVERLDDVTAVVGPHTAELWTCETVRTRMIPVDWVSAQFGPLLAGLRDQAFA